MLREKIIAEFIAGGLRFKKNFIFPELTAFTYLYVRTSSVLARTNLGELNLVVAGVLPALRRPRATPHRAVSRSLSRSANSHAHILPL